MHDKLGSSEMSSALLFHRQLPNKPPVSEMDSKAKKQRQKTKLRWHLWIPSNGRVDVAKTNLSEKERHNFTHWVEVLLEKRLTEATFFAF